MEPNKSTLGRPRPFRLVAGQASIFDLVDGHMAAGLALAGAKTVYFCDDDAGNDGNTGLGGWENSFKTLTKALAVSHADIALNKYGWSARNVILARGGAFEEDLDLLAQKTDVIGVGSNGPVPMCGLTGNHTPVSATSSYATRFFNFHFHADTSGGDMWILGSAVSNLGFYGCEFQSPNSAEATAAIVATASPGLQVVGCKLWGAFSDAAIEIGTGNAGGLRITDNYIEGANQGVHIGSGAEDASGGDNAMLVKDNLIFTATECIKDESGKALVIDNRCVSEQASGLNGVGVIDSEENLAIGNFITASDRTNMPWPAEQAVT